jgi:hypothetical protein
MIKLGAGADWRDRHRGITISQSGEMLNVNAGNLTWS